MSIDVSNLLSLFSSVAGLDGLQLSESGDIGASEGFAEALMEQVKLLQEQGELPSDLDSLSELQEFPGTKETGKLQEFAGLLNDYGKTTESVHESGNKLPLLSELEKDINIEETIVKLQDVMQHIAAVTDLVEEKAAEVADVLEQAVAFLQADGNSEQLLDQQQQTVAPLFSSQVGMTNDEVDAGSEWATDTLIKDTLKDEVLLQSTPVSKEETVISDTIAEQKNIQQVFSKEFEKTTPVNPVPGNSVESATKSDKVVEVVSDSEQEFLDDMFNNDQSTFKPGQEASVVDKPKQAEFDLHGVSAINSAEKPVANYAGDISLLNRQMVNAGNEIKTEAPPMTRPFNHPEWQNEFSERIVWMHNKSVPSAELRLNPQHLGPVSIRIDVNQDQATIGFTAQHASVREAIEAAIPKLREMLNGQQVNLAEVNVSQQDFSEQRQPQGFSQNGQKHNSQQEANFSMDEVNAETIETAAELTEEIERGRALASNGLLNIYA